MKRLSAIFAIIFFMPVFALAQDTGWVIEGINSDVTVRQDGKVNIVERINVDFGSLNKHGIFRDIPTEYDLGGGSKLYSEVKVLGVRDQFSKKVPHKVTYKSDFTRIKIGDPNKTISGKNIYFIEYQIEGILRSFQGYDELYLDVVGSEWKVPINGASADVSVQGAEILDKVCFRGPFGSTDNCDSIIGNETVRAENQQVINPGESFSVVVAFEPGIIPILSVEGVEPVNKSSIAAFILALIAGLLGSWLIWYHKGRDFHYQRFDLIKRDLRGQPVPVMHYEPIIVQYDPPEKTPPAMVGLIIDEKVNTEDVSSTIVDLAIRGFLKIKEIKKKEILGMAIGSQDYLIVDQKKDTKDLLKYENLILDKLFKSGTNEIKMSDLKTSQINTSYKKIVDEIYAEGKTRKLFVKSPPKVIKKHAGWAYGIGFVVFYLSLFSAALVFLSESSRYILQAALIGILIALIVHLIFTSRKMPQKTVVGRELYKKSLGFREFVSKTEEHKSQFFESHGVFMKVLPYAMAFGVAGKLVKAMAKMGVDMTSFAGAGWYVGDNVAFADSLDNINSGLNKSMSAIATKAGQGSGFSGGGFSGGFSGGGFGGGGGGSW